jgi:hypothetical protein
MKDYRKVCVIITALFCFSMPASAEKNHGDIS